MYTQCPECGTVFRVTAAVLRAAQAQVRCGVCDAHFNALHFLSDELAGDAGESASTDARAAEATLLSTPASAIAPTAVPAELPAATRNTPSADEARAFEALQARLTAAAPDAPAQQDAGMAMAERAALEPDEPDEPVEPVELVELDDSLFDEPVTQPDLTAASLEFNAPPADWERIFIPPDSATPAIALDLSLLPTEADPGQADPQDFLLPAEPAPDTDDEPNEDELHYARLTTEVASEAVADEATIDPELNWPTSPSDATAAPPPDAMVDVAADLAEHVEAEIDVLASPADAELEFDVDIDLNAALATTPSPPLMADGDDPLARTDEFPLPDFAMVASTLDADDAPLGADTDSGSDEVMDTGEVATDDAPEPLDEHPALSAEPALVTATFDQPPAPPAPTRAPWQLAAAIVLSLALVAQFVHHARESLIETPIIGPPLASLYAAVGAPIEPRWNLGDYEVRQWGSASEDAPGALRLRASIVNHASRGQPYPLLRVLLADRFGGTVARREFRPAEYLPGRLPPNGALAPGARVDADLHLADPGKQAVGFELDVCLERHGVLSCGSDPRPPGN